MKTLVKKSALLIGCVMLATAMMSAQASKTSIQTMPGWQNCTVCAGIGANGPSASYSMTQNQKSPSLSGHSAKFSISGKTPYSDALWWKQLGANNSATHLKYDVDFYLTTPQYAQNLEFDNNQAIGKTKFIFGTQCNIRNRGDWDVWDTKGSAWRPTGIPCHAPSAFKWHHLTWQ